MATARSLAVDVLLRVLYRGAFADIALSSALSKSNLDSRDKGLCTEVVYGTLRRLLSIDWTLDAYLKRPVKHAEQTVAAILRAGAYQILYLDRVPGYAVVDTSVEIARRMAPRATGLINAVLRRILREGPRDLPPASEQVKRLSVLHSHPEWLIRNLIERIGVQQTEAFCAANNKPPEPNLRVNLLRSSVAGAICSLHEQGVETVNCRYAPEGLSVSKSTLPIEEARAHIEGKIYVMDEAAMLVAPALSPEPGSRVLDSCAAPGGKTAHMAAIMENRGEIVALDPNRSRLKMITENCERLGVSIVTTVEADARNTGSSRGKFDYVLIDAPCSGLGVLRRRPDLRWRKQQENLTELPELQAEIFESVAGMLVEGGVLVYSTCSVHEDENQNMIKAFLARHQDYKLDPGLKDHVPSLLRQESSAGMLQMWPHIHGTDGFFIARLRKEKS